MATLNQRIAALEQKTLNVRQNVFRIICKVAPSAAEQAQIDEAEARGDFVIIRLIVNNPLAKSTDDRTQEENMKGVSCGHA